MSEFVEPEPASSTSQTDDPAESGDPSGTASPVATTDANGQSLERGSNRLDRGRDWVTSKRNRVDNVLQERRQRGGAVAAGFDLQGLDAAVGGGILAGAMAFRMFLFLVPFVYVLFTLFGLVARAESQDPTQLAKTVGITGILASAVVNTQEISAWTQLFLMLGALVALIITAYTFARTIYVVHWLIWRVPQKRPAGFRSVAVVVSLAVVLAVFGTAANYLRSIAGATGVVLLILIVTAVAFGVWWWVSIQLPHADLPATALIPGAILMAVGMDVMHLLTTYWIGNVVARKSNTYGAVGIALAVLLWVYILGRIMVGSAGLNAALWQRRQTTRLH